MGIDLIGQDAFDLIVKEEDSDAAYYARHYTHFEWPGGASGPTVGIGYDLGYVTTDECVRDWLDIIPDDQIATLLLGVGLHGEPARLFVAAHAKDVTISWDQAIKQFSEREILKWVQRVKETLPNCNLLPIDCFGALVSLAYNRGSDKFKMGGDRNVEMVNIRYLMSLKNFAAIPSEIRGMQRLWPKGGGLWNRRAHEAALFEQGLRKAAA